jgi:hypothetical protein
MQARIGKLRQYQKEQAIIAQLQLAADKLQCGRLWGTTSFKARFSMEKRMERLHTVD